MVIHWEAVFTFLIPSPWIGFAFLIAKGGIRMRDGSMFTPKTKPIAFRAYLFLCALVTALTTVAGVSALLGIVPVN